MRLISLRIFVFDSYFNKLSTEIIKMQEAFVNVLNVPTHVMTWGGWIESSLDSFKEIVICIPGNPGLPGYYTKYLAEVHTQLGKDIPVWIVGHAGHNEPSQNTLRTVPEITNNEHLYNLDGQVKHKVEFIKTYVPQHTKIHLVGHSIGAWMILQLLKDSEISAKIKHTYLLFPTIERMAVSSNGKFCVNYVLPLKRIIHYILILFCMLPLLIRTYLINAYFALFSIPKCYLGTTLQYIQTSVMDKVIFLANDEMKRVKDLDENLIREHHSRLKLYYGSSDGWAPQTYYYDLKNKFSSIDAELCQKKIEHAFVLRSPREMGVMTAEWILSKSG